MGVHAGAHVLGLSVCAGAPWCITVLAAVRMVLRPQGALGTGLFGHRLAP